MSFSGKLISDLKCTPNSIVLVRSTEKNKYYYELPLLAKDKSSGEIAKGFIKSLLAENDIKTEFDVMLSARINFTHKNKNGKEITTVYEKASDLSNKVYVSIIRKYLNTTTIYKADAKGKLTTHVDCKFGTFKDTILNVQRNSVVLQFTDKTRDIVIAAFAKVFAKQLLWTDTVAKALKKYDTTAKKAGKKSDKKVPAAPIEKTPKDTAKEQKTA